MGEYLEFVATRRTREQGFSVEEPENSYEVRDYAKIRRAAVNVLESVPYDAYEENTCFLLYLEEPGCFAAVRAAEGGQVDRRVNMELTLCVPVRRGSDQGFDACYQKLFAWMCPWEQDPLHSCEHQRMAEACRRQGITQIWLEAFLIRWLRSVCAQQAETICICDSRVPELSEETMLLLAGVAYQFLPEERRRKYSFACHARPEKCHSSRLLVSQHQGDGIVLDLAKEPELKMDGRIDAPLIQSVVREFFQGNAGGRLLDGIDWYFIQAGDYDSLVKNFYYYWMDRNLPLTLTEEQFQKMQVELSGSRSEKAEELYRWLTAQRMKDTDGMDFWKAIDLYLRVPHQGADYKEEELEILWRLMTEHAAFREPMEGVFEECLQEVQNRSMPLYTALLRYGMSGGRFESVGIGLDSFLPVHPENKLEDIEQWLEWPESEAFLDNEQVQERLIGKIGGLLLETKETSRAKRLAKTGNKVNTSLFLKYRQQYLQQGTRQYMDAGDICGWRGYLETYKEFWGISPELSPLLAAEFTEFVRPMEVPLRRDQMKAVADIKNFFGRSAAELEKKSVSAEKQRLHHDAAYQIEEELRQVQRTLLGRFCEKGADAVSDYNLYRDELSALLRWQVGNDMGEPVFREARMLLEEIGQRYRADKMTRMSLEELLDYQIGQDTEDLDAAYEDWLNALALEIRNKTDAKRVREELEWRLPNVQVHGGAGVYKVLTALLDADAGNLSGRLSTAELSTKLSMREEESFLRSFWEEGIGIEDFSGIWKREKEGKGQRRILHGFIEKETDSVTRELYKIYRSFARGESSDREGKKLRQMWETMRLSDETAVRLFENLLRCSREKGRKHLDDLENLYDLMFVYCDGEEAVWDFVERLNPSAKERKTLQAIREEDKQYAEGSEEKKAAGKQARKTDWEEDTEESFLDWRQLILKDFLYGCLFGGILGIFEWIFSLLEPNSSVIPAVVTVAFFVLLGFVVYQIFLSFDRIEKISLSAMIFVIGFWAIQNCIPDAGAAPLIVGIVLTAGGVAGVILERR